MRFLLGLVTAALMAGCVAPPRQTPMVWMRTDGQRMRGNPELTGKFHVDQTVCVGEVQKVAAGAAPVYYQGIFGAMAADQVISQRQSAHRDIMRGCMAEKGYLLTPATSSEEVAEQVRNNL